MRRAAFAIIAAGIMLSTSSAHALIHCASNPFHPLCCPSPCPVTDSTLIQRFVSTAKDLGKSGDFLFVAENALSAARQTIGLITNFSWYAPGVSALSRDDRLESVGDLWRPSSSASDERDIQIRLQRLASQLAVAALADWSVQRSSTPSSWAPAASSLAAGGDVTTLAQAAGKALGALTLLRIEQSAAQTSIARYASVNTPFRPTAGGRSAADAEIGVSPNAPASPAAAITELELALIPIVGWNNDRASAAAIAARYDDLGFAIDQHIAATRDVEAGQRAIEDLIARAYRDPRAARVNAVLLLRERDTTNYDDSFVKGLAAQRAGTDLFEVLSVTPRRLGVPTGDPFCQDSGDDRTGGQACLVRVLDTSAAMLEALKREAFWRQPRAEAEALRLRLVAMLGELTSRNDHDPLAADAGALQQRAADRFLRRIGELEPQLTGTSHPERFTRIGTALREGAISPVHVNVE